MNVPSTSSSSSSSSSAPTPPPADHGTSTPSVIFVPPPLPAFLATPCRPGFQVPPVRHPSTAQSTQPPPPRPKFRRVAWSKIPASRVLGRNNVWTTSDRMFREFKLDFERIEELFAVSASASTPPTAPSSPSASTGVKYPVSVSAGGPQEACGRASAASTSKPPAHPSEVSIYHVLIDCVMWPCNLSTGQSSSPGCYMPPVPGGGLRRRLTGS